MDDGDLGLAWPIKRSFILYVARMTEGQVLGGHVLRMTDASTFLFPVLDASADGTVRFGGELRLAAHAGALDLRIARPRIDLTADRATLLIDRPEGSADPLPFVTCVVGLADDSDGVRRWRGTDVRLTVDAVPLFGGYYGEGESFDDLSITMRPSRSS